MQKLFLPKPLAVPNQGWTLIEMLIVTIIVGILSSLAIPSIMSGKGKSDLRSAMGQAKGAIQEAQRAAIKNGQSCTVIINPTTTSASVTVSGTSVSVNAKTITGSPAGCISSTVSITDVDTTFATPTVATSFSFSYKGNTTTDLTIALQSAKTAQKYCLVVSSGIGIMRSGTYSGTTCTSSF
jgi:prepilin-type N-terminal cleavage/methylation domain-containing protein